MNYKKISTGIATTLVVAAFLAACSEKVEVGGNDSADGIGISVSVRQNWNNTDAKKSAPQATRAAQTENNMATQVIQAEGNIGGDPVYLWCDEIKGIDGKGLSVEVEAAQDEATRGTLMSGIKNGNEFDPESFYDKFSIYGEKAHGGRRATWRHDNEWTLSSPFAWGDDHDFKFAFYGIAPVGAEGMLESDIHEHFRFTYDTPRNATKQSDIMVAMAEAKHSDRHIRFPFKHVLTAIKFKVGDFKGGYKITRVELEGIYKTRTYNLEEMRWLDYSTTDTKFGATTTAFSTVPGDGVPTEPANKFITSDSEGTTFIVLPQTVPANAWAIITLVPDGSDTPEYIRASISGIEWQEGYTYTYTISSSEYPSDYEFGVEENPTFNYEGNAASEGSDIFKVTSYKKSDNSAVPWTAIGYKLENEDGTYPNEWSPTETTMLNNTGFSGNGGMVAEKKTVSVKPQNPTVSTIWRRESNLRARTEKENLDLSLYKVDNKTQVQRTTANCYIVRQGGTYKIPLVIGNTIRNGNVWTPQNYMTTSSAFQTYSNQTNSATCYYGYEMFKDYSGAVVTSTNYRITNATAAEIVWHDFRDMNSDTGLDVITNLAVTTADTDGLHYLTFSVDKDKIQQGNAVLAVKDNADDIIWSWHIYITDLDWTTDQATMTNFQGDAYNIPTENLGYVEGGQRLRTYKARKMKVLLEQNISGKRAEVTITQNGLPPVVEILDQWDTKYQWARKDAFPGTVKYTGKHSPSTNLATNYYESIKNPSTRWWFNNSSEGGKWYGGNIFINGWSANNDKVPTTNTAATSITEIYKTIYDPCPPGFCVPLPRVFTGITTTGAEVTNVDQQANRDKVNAKGEWASGWNFYCNGNSETVYFAATGLINTSSLTISKPESQGLSWSAIPRMNTSTGSTYTAWNMSFEWDPPTDPPTCNVRPLANNVQRSALPVRPMVDNPPPANINHGVDVGNYGNGGTGNLDLQ